MFKVGDKVTVSGWIYIIKCQYESEYSSLRDCWTCIDIDGNEISFLERELELYKDTSRKRIKPPLWKRLEK